MRPRTPERLPSPPDRPKLTVTPLKQAVEAHESRGGF